MTREMGDKRLSFRRRKHKQPGLNTSSLPDLIFTVLFFFMIVTHMRDHENLLRYQVPQGSQLEQQGHKSSIVHIYIGRLLNSTDTTTCIQIDNRLCSIDEVSSLIGEARSQMTGEDQMRMTVVIKADRDTPLGIIADVKQQLQRCGALRVSYAATGE